MSVVASSTCTNGFAMALSGVRVARVAVPAPVAGLGERSVTPFVSATRCCMGWPQRLSRTMDFDLSDEQRAFAETARQFARDEWLPHAPGWDEREEFPEDALRGAAALGFAGIYVRDQFGGSGLTRLDATIIFEELASACVSTAAYLSIHNMAAWMIDRFGDPAPRARFLPPLMTMEH